MSEERVALPGCSDPSQGRLLEDYLDRRLSEGEASSFEDHYFRCSVCLDEIQQRQAMPDALKDAGGRPHRAVPWMSMAAALAALLLAYPAYRGVFELPEVSRRAGALEEENSRLREETTRLESSLKRSDERTDRQPAWTGTLALTVLTGPSRGGEAVPVVTVSPGQPYVLLAATPSLRGSLDGDAVLRFEMHGETGEAVWSVEMTAARLREAVRSARVVTFLIPSDALRPGRYTLTLRRAAAAPGDAMFRASFEVRSAG